MVGASSRLLFFLTSPICLRHHRPFALIRLARRHSLTSPLPTLSVAAHRLLHLSRPDSLTSIKFSQNYYSRATNSALQENSHVPANDYLVPPSHPWPEWSCLIESLSVAGYFNRNSNIEDEFVANENLSMEFVAAASSCLAFARDRPDILGWLPRKDIEVLINDGSPFLFKNAFETERRMRSFLQAEGSNEAISMDLMKYILSYASNPIIYPERNIKEATESSVRSLLQEMANLSCRGEASDQFQAVGRDGQIPRNLGPNITMKRGDWICPKCSFMNFARNTKCLECEELRPQRQLTDGEWDCPRCNFFNYRRNVVCLKCKCKRPGEAPLPGSLGPAKTTFDRQLSSSHYRNTYGDNGTPGGNDFRMTNKNLESSLGHNPDEFRGNASSVSGTYTTSMERGQSDKKDGRSHIAMGSNSSYVPFVPLSDDMFAKKPEKMTAEHNEEAAVRGFKSVKAGDNSQYSEKSATNVRSSETPGKDEEDKSERWFKKIKELHGVTESGNGSFVQEDNGVGKKKDQPFSPYQRQQTMDQGSNGGFIPFPPDYFAKKDNQQQPKNTDPTAKPTDEISSSHLSNESSNKQVIGNQQMRSTQKLHSRSSTGNEGLFSGDTNADSYRNQFRSEETGPETSKVGQQTPGKLNVRSGWTGKSLEGSAVIEPDPLDMSEEAKAERWFRRVAQIKDISELSQIPDEDFPSIMPMRKGVNRFVVSKRKTPLERRLTSPQHRKNLRIMSSDPMKKEGDNDN